MCGAAAWAFSASMLSHFSTTTKVSGPYLVCTGSAGSASTAAPYSMQPRSARTLGTLARKCLSTSSRLPGLAVMTAMTWIIWFALPEGLARAELDRLSYRPVDHAARRGNDSPGAAPGGGGDLRRAGGRGLAGRDRG